MATVRDPGPVYPGIAPVPESVDRPFWSVMIPVYNCADYLRLALRSVLPQFAGTDDVQIEVVDDGSTRDDPEAAVAECGAGRVTYFRQPQNVGPQANFTACVQRARGRWVHILHGDDMVMPGFYRALKTAAECRSDIGAAFCRIINIDAVNEIIDMSPLELDEAGVHENLIERLAIQNLIMFPGIVVKRSTYERVGGFHPELFHSADWDMWKRVALAAPVWYEPTALAMYRTHHKSDTFNLMQTGANIADARHAIQIAHRYLPEANANEWSRRASRHHGLYALEVADQMVASRAWAAARAQVVEAFRCSLSPQIVFGGLRVAAHAARQLTSQRSRQTNR